MEVATPSPDMNPSENVWNYLSGLIRSHLNLPMGILDLLQGTVKEWANIPQEFIDNLTHMCKCFITKQDWKYEVFT